MSSAPAVPQLEVTSPSNPRVKSLVALRRRRTRDQQNVTLVEGQEELTLALTCGVHPITLYYCPALTTSLDLVTQAAALGTEIVQMTRPAFEKAAYRESPDGWLAVVPSIKDDLEALEPGLILVCQGVEKPGNLGAMLRTADAAGATAVISADPVTDWGNPNLIRASKGTIFSVPVAAATTEAALTWLNKTNHKIITTTPDAETLYTEADLTARTAIVVGSEKHGVTADWLAAATERVRIPMTGTANSLNVATSAALVLYEAIRQRPN